VLQSHSGTNEAKDLVAPLDDLHAGDRLEQPARDADPSRNGTDQTRERDVGARGILHDDEQVRVIGHQHVGARAGKRIPGSLPKPGRVKGIAERGARRYGARREVHEIHSRPRCTIRAARSSA
jgi:hypothetical protein